MAPKKDHRAASPTGEADPRPGPPDEVQEGEPGTTATFTVEVQGVANLPRVFETKVCVSGLCKEFRSANAEVSASPSGWAFERSSFTRQRAQPLYDDMVNNVVTLEVKHGTTFEVIGTVQVSLSPLLHDQLEVGGTLPLKLTDQYRLKWLPDPSEGDASERVLPPVEEVPQTTLSVFIRVSELVGPETDRSSWTMLSIRCGGAFSLPKKMTGLGLIGPADVELHQLTYRAVLFGESFPGLLAKAAGERPTPPAAAPAGDEGGEEPPQPTEEERCADEERYSLSVRFARAEKIVFYRGADFIRNFRHALNNVGGVWLHFVPKERPSADPKKPNPPEVAALASQGLGKAWIDLRPLIRPDIRTTGDLRCRLISSKTNSESFTEPLLETSGAFVRVALELSHDTRPPLPAEKLMVLPQLLSHQKGAGDVAKFPASSDAVALYKDAVQRSFTEVAHAMGNSTVQVPRSGMSTKAAVELLKRGGQYEQVKADMRAAVVQVCRERLRKDIAVIPGNPLTGDARDKFMANAHSYLKGTLVDIIDTLRENQPPPSQRLVLQESQPANDRGGARSTSRRTSASTSSKRASFASSVSVCVPVSPAYSQAQQTAGWKLSSAEAANEVRRRSLSAKSSKSPAGAGAEPGTPEGASSPGAGAGRSCDAIDMASMYQNRAGTEEDSQAFDPVQAALDESTSAQRSRKALGAVADTSARLERLAFEAELVEHWGRAAAMLQSRLVLPECKNDASAWVAYAKLCCRAGGRQAAAEEALQQAARLDPAEQGEAHFMLAALLLDRGRHSEAISRFRAMHEADFAEPTYRFFLGLALFLADGGAEAACMLASAGKPRAWFVGVPDDEAVAAKLAKAQAQGAKHPEPLDVAPYVRCLEKLLDFGLAQLVFTFVDQSGTLPPASLDSEPIALLDAKASALERDYAAALARLEPLLARREGDAEASREACRLAGDCHYFLQDYDRALQVVNKALAFENQFEDPAFYIRYGHVLLQKKRWKQARDAFLRSIAFMPTAEAWFGVAYAEYRSDELSTCLEALSEANLLDHERPDVWAQLSLVHLRLENYENADKCFTRCLAGDPDCDDLLLEVSAEFVRREKTPALAEAAARRALSIRDSGHGHAALADALAAQDQVAQAVAEATAAVERLVDLPEPRKQLFERAARWCEALPGSPLVEELQAAQRLADQQCHEHHLVRESEHAH